MLVLIGWNAILKTKGFLLCTDWYLDPNQLSFIHLLFHGDLDELKPPQRRRQVEINKNIVILRSGLQRNSHLVKINHENMMNILASFSTSLNIMISNSEKMNLFDCEWELTSKSTHICVNFSSIDAKRRRIGLTLDACICKPFEKLESLGVWCADNSDEGKVGFEKKSN